MRAIGKRLGKLEGRFGLVETEERRRARARVETLRRRIAAQRAREGLPPLELDPDGQDLTGLSLSKILRLRFKAPKQPVPQESAYR
jgi:hypothetical protein